MGHDLLRAVLVLICISHIKSQYYDLFQAFQPLAQPQPSQPLNFFNDFTTKRPRSKQKIIIADVVHNDNVRKPDKIIITDNIHNDNARKTLPLEPTAKSKQTTRRKQTNAPVFDTNFFTTTQRAIRKTTKYPSLTSVYNQPQSSEQQQSQNSKETSAIVFFDDDYKTKPEHSRTGSKTDSRESSHNSRDRPQPVSSLNDIKSQNQQLIATNYDSSSWQDGRINSVNSYTTRPPYYGTTNSYNYLQNNNKNKNTNLYTTHNPLLNRPGVKPAIIHGPPITNKPVTQRPVFEPKHQGINFNDDLSVSPEVISGPDEDYMSDVEKKKYVDIAEKMCDKYKSLSIKQVEVIPLVPSPQPVRVNVSSCIPTTVPLVVGGKVVSIQEFPHMALLGWRKVKSRDYSWKCGGTLLSNQYVLTAAHCAYQDRDDNVIAGPPRIVQLGSSYLNDPNAVFTKVSAVIRHPKYKLPKAYFDLAIVKMASTVSFTEMIKPACLGTPPAVNHPIIATGWGRTEFGGSQSHELRSVSIPVWDLSECHNALGVSVKIPYGPLSDSQICAGERSGGKDTCQGDSGGPAQIQDGCIWRVVAVTSVGRYCGAAGTPAIYATVQRAFVSAVVFAKETESNKNSNSDNHSTNNNRNYSHQGTNNNQEIGNDDRNNKRTNEQSSLSDTNQQNNKRQNNRTNYRKQNSNSGSGTTSEYGNNEESYNWNRNRDNNYKQNNQQVYPTNNYNVQNNQPNRNEYSNNFNNYNSQRADNYNSNERKETNYYNQPTTATREIETMGGEYYNNYAGSNNYRDSYSRQRDYVQDSGRETYNSDNGNVWWT